MKRLLTLAFCAWLMAGCSSGASEAKVEAAIQKCIEDGQANFSDKVSVSDPDPDRRAAAEQRAKQAVAQVAEAHKRQVEAMCRQMMPVHCEKNPGSC